MRSEVLVGVIALLVIVVIGYEAFAEDVTNIVVPSGSSPAWTLQHEEYDATIGKTHVGVDIFGANPARGGDPVYPLADGIVVSICEGVRTFNCSPDFGNAIMIRHPGLGRGGSDLYSIYLHLEGKPRFSSGDRVVGGATQIGRIGKTGAANNAYHVHFEIRYFSTWLFLKWGNIYCPGDCRGSNDIASFWEDPQSIDLSPSSSVQIKTLQDLDRNSNNLIDTEEFLETLDLWWKGRISTELFNQALDYWASQRPISGGRQPSTQPISLLDYTTAKGAQDEYPYDAINRTSTFATTDDRVYAWVKVGPISGTHTLQRKWYRPDGSLYATSDPETIGRTGKTYDWWKEDGYISIEGYEPASTPGQWRVDVFLDGARLVTMEFTIQRVRVSVPSQGSPPRIVSMNPPATIAGEATWSLQFEDLDGDVTWAQVEYWIDGRWVDGSRPSGGWNPKVFGRTQGTIWIRTTCSRIQVLTKRVVLWDAQGHGAASNFYTQRCTAISSSAVDESVGGFDEFSHSGQPPAEKLQVLLSTYNQTTIFNVQKPIIGPIQVDIYTLNGQKVFSETTLASHLTWRWQDKSGSPIANGIYLYQVTIQGPNGFIARSEIEKVMVLR